MFSPKISKKIKRIELIIFFLIMNFYLKKDIKSQIILIEIEGLKMKIKMNL